MNKTEAISNINKRASLKEPFLFVINYNMDNCLVLSPEDACLQNILFNFNGIKNYHYEQLIATNIKFEKHPVEFAKYLAAFYKVQKHLNRGNSYLVNLTFPTPVETNLSLSDIFYSAFAKYKLLMKDQFMVFSPESFVKIENGEISTYPMKGTIDAGEPNAPEKLLTNKKELAEHATIVDLLRNDLSKTATNVRVEKFRYIDEIKACGKQLLQVSSKITGTLPGNYHENLGNILFEMLPAGSVTGAPKAKTLEIIAEAEKYERGFYTGIAGYFDGKKLDSCVLIRFIEKCNGKLIYKSGGGITSQSNVKQEYQELIDKIYVPVS
jgi:para-aminobenzoate synthetase component 1